MLRKQMPQFNILYSEDASPTYDKNFTRSCVGFRTKNTLKFQKHHELYSKYCK